MPNATDMPNATETMPPAEDKPLDAPDASSKPLDAFDAAEAGVMSSSEDEDEDDASPKKRKRQLEKTVELQAAMHEVASQPPLLHSCVYIIMQKWGLL